VSASCCAVSVAVCRIGRIEIVPRELLTGWGRTAPSATTVVRRRSSDRHGLVELVRSLPPRGAIARGLGRSYGDSAQNGGGLTIRLDDAVAPRSIDVDAGAATVAADAGVSFDAVLRASVPAGLFVPVSPGTRYVTVGGAIASDIHGKNHHVDGTLGRHVTSLTLLLADGTTVELGPRRQPALFWATIGGMGLTGIIVRATFSMLTVESSRMCVDTERAADLEHLIELMVSGDEAYRYSVAWIDVMARGAALGRSVLTRGNHARVEELAPRQAVRPLEYRPVQVATVPALIPRRGLLNHTSIAAFNEAWFRLAPRRRIGEIVSIPRFFYPLDAVGSWNRLYGRRGFLQYQFVVPFGQEAALRRVVERLAGSGTASFLAVLKRFGPANPAPLSFPKPGWTLALDIPAGVDGLASLLAELDDLVLEAGGRHYLAKDSVTTAAAIRRGYPRLAEWQAIRDSVDPERKWASDQSRRLRLTEPVGAEPGVGA
jgi:decaprenylphospho-beta-D-ribofuranose 2-oxidase